MQDDIHSSGVLGHLKEILRGRYGRELEIVRMMGLGGDGNHTDYIQVGQELHVPLKHNELLLGKAVLRGAMPLNETQVYRAVQTVKFALEGLFYRDYLRIVQSNNSVCSSGEGLVDSVISIADEESVLVEKIHGGSPLCSPLIVLEGSTEELSSRLCVDIHELSGLQSLVQFSDIKSSLKNFNEILQIPNTTIRIKNEDLENLPLCTWLCQKDIQELQIDGLILVEDSKKKLTLSQNIPRIPVDRLPLHRTLRFESLRLLLEKDFQQ